MAELKTRPTANSVSAFLRKIKDPQLRKDCLTIAEMMESIAKVKPVMWGSSIVGYGTRHYVYASGREGDWMTIGFSPRKQAISLYLCCGLEPLRTDLAKLGKHSAGVGCLYIKSLSDIHLPTLKKIVTKSYRSAK